MANATARQIVLTGVTRGLGSVLTKAFIDRKHIVAGCGRSRPEIERLAATFGAPHSFAAVDVADDAQVAAWASAVIARHGPPDLLINNAALINRNAPLWEVPAAEFARVIDVNIKGVVNIIRHFLPPMLEPRRGVIVNLSSGWGRATSPEVAPYCATKWAIEGLTQAFAQELPEGMAAVALNPGIIDTAMLRSCFGEAAGEYPTPDEWVKQAVPFLLELGPRHNGQSLTVPGAAE